MYQLFDVWQVLTFLNELVYIFNLRNKFTKYKSEH